MEIDENAAAHAHLKQMLLQQIESQERTQKILKRIFRRISLIYISISAVIIVGIMFLIYINSRPESLAKQAIRDMNSLNTRISLQREYIEMDRKELEAQRNDLTELKMIQDSIRKN